MEDGNMRQGKACVLLTGDTGAGKDTFAGLLSAELGRSPSDRVIFSSAFAEPLKGAFACVFGEEISQAFESRKLDRAVPCPRLGGRTYFQAMYDIQERAALGRSDPDFLPRELLDRWVATKADVLIVTDLRRQSEADFIRDNFPGQVQIIRIHNKNNPHSPGKLDGTARRIRADRHVSSAMGDLGDLCAQAKAVAAWLALPPNRKEKLTEITPAFLTGSRAYGVPTRHSDVDLVVRMTPGGARAFAAAIAEADGPSLVSLREKYPTGAGLSLRFGQLNMIVATTDKAYRDWEEGTGLLKRHPEPASRDTAISVFKEIRANTR